jgi:hypothetical protein
MCVYLLVISGNVARMVEVNTHNSFVETPEKSLEISTEEMT